MQSFYSGVPGNVAMYGTPKTNGKNWIPSKGILYFEKSHLPFLLLLLITILSSADLYGQTCTCSGTNLVQNHSWENGTNSWNWSGGNLSTGTYAAQCGTNAGHFQITNTGNNWVSQQIGTVGSNGISAGSIITLKVYGGTHNPSFYHQVGISYFTSNWTYISGNYTEVNAQLPSMAEYTVTSVVPSNAHFITVEKGGNGDWVKTDRWCATVSQCNPDNSSAPPYCAPTPVCPTGNNFLWSQSINPTDGTPSTVRLVCSSALTYTIPGSYPSAFNGPVNVTVSDVVSWDGYSGRGSVTQQNERWRILFRKNGTTVHATPYTNDVPDLKTQAYWRGALGTTVYLPNGADQIVIEHWSVANNSSCSNGPNSVVPVSVCIGYTPVTCSNVTNGGQIGSNQTSCLATYDPAPFTNITSPSGGSGTLEYLWLRSTTTCIAPNGSNDSEWEAIPNSNSSTYDPGPLYQNTCYIRCSRRSGCTNYDGESNVVSVTVSGPAVQIGSALTLVKDRVISDEIHCSNSNQRVLWLDCLLDNASGGTSGNRKYWKIISGGTFREYCDGTAYFEMRVQNLVTTTYQLDIKVVLSGRTYSAPPGSPHIEGCTTSAASDWYYYTNMTGTITGVNGLAGALLSIDRKGGSFQIGTNASLYAGPGQFGASGWLIYNVINHPTSFKMKGECGADFNFLLSGGALTSAQASNCQSICVGASTQLTANGAGGKPGYTYAWDNSLGTGQTKTVSPTVTTSYKVTITDTNGCTATSQTTIHVNPQPVLNAGQDVGICSGQSVLLTVNATNGTPPYTYTWPNPPGGTGTSKSVSPTVTTTYIVTVTDAKGCTATDDVKVTVNPNPAVTTSANAVCTGGTLVISSTPTGGTSPYTYAWTGPNGFTASTQNISRSNATTSMAGTYSLVLTDSKGCVATSSVTVSITPGPTVSLGPDKSICTGDEIDIHSEVTGIPTCGTPGINRCDNPIVNSGGYIANQNTAAVCGDNAGAKLWTQGGNGTSFLTLDMSASRPAGTQICVRVKLEHCSNTSSSNSDMRIRISGSATTGFTDLVATRTFSHTSYQTYCYNLPTAARYVRVQDNGKCSFRLDYVEFTTPNNFTNTVTYSWSGPGIIGSTTGDYITVNQNGTYVLVVTDCNGCTASDDINISINNNVNVNVADKEICLGQSATLTANLISGATYEWREEGNDGVISTAQSITVSPSSTKVYIVTARVNGCENSDDATVFVNTPPTVTTQAPEVCVGSTLAITSTPSGGTPGYTYVWSGPGGFSAITQNVSRPNATVAMSGTYSVTVTDTKGCTGVSSVSATVNPNLNVTTNAPDVCVGSTLAITSSPSGGTPGYTYVWSGPGGFSASTQNISRPNATVAMSGTYSVTVTDTKGCTGVSSVSATVNPNLNVTTNAPEVCVSSTLAITSSPSGGTPGYTYLWNGPGGFSASTQNISRPNATVGMSGTYSVTVTDTKGCTGVSSVSATVNPNPTLQASSNSPVCIGEQINLFAMPSGGTPGYNYTWSGPNGYSSSVQNPVRNNADNTMTGIYNVTVTDNKGCVANSSTDVSLTPKPTSGIDGPQTTCAKESVLFIATPPAGAGAVYSWTFQGGTPAVGSGTSVSVQWNSPGTYTIQLVVTKDGCDAQYTRSIVITEEVFSLAGPDKDICQGGFTVLNGQGPAGGNFTWTVVSGDPTSIDGGASSPNLTVSPLFTTVYRLTVSQNGCVRTSDVTVFVNVSLNPIANAGFPLEICAGVTTTIGGNPTGTPPPGAPNTPLGYTWTPVTGLNSGSVANPTLTLNTPGAFTYQVIVEALISGCKDTAEVTHTIVPKPTVTANAPEVCVGSTLSITSTPNGGTPGYTYMWSGPGGFSANTQNISRDNASVAMSGTYNVTVTDHKGCIANTSVSAIVNPNPTITAAAPEVCEGFTLEINSTPNGGTPGYTYSWSGPGGFTAGTQNISRANASVAMSGQYSVTVTDLKGCTGVFTLNAVVNPNPGLQVSSNSPVCIGEQITLFATPSGGTPGFIYVWSGPNSYTSNVQNPVRNNADNTMVGTYYVTITDSKGCIANSSTSVSLTPKPISGIDGPQTTCAREAVLFIATPPAGAGATYNWTFQNGIPANATGPSATSQWNSPGEYLITLVVTKDGCTSTYTRTIIITQEVFSAAGPDKEICQGGNVTLNGQGPAGANFSWTVVAGDPTSIDNGGSTMNLLVSPLFTTTYRLTVSQNGCVRTDEVTVFVNVNLNPIADAGNPLDICSGIITTIGGNPTGTPPPGAPNTPLGYIWSPGTGLNSITLPNPTLNLTNPGTYTYQVIVIALATGCTDTATVTHTIVPNPTVSALAPEVCAGFTLEISSTPNGGTPGYTYNWSGPGGFTASTQNISRANSTVSMSGTYNLTITDSKGCVGTTSVNATVNPGLTVSALAPEVCAGFTLEISSTPNGGTPGYTYNWSGPGGFTASTQNISRANSTVSMSGTYNLTITDSKGCVGTTSVNATVNPNPTASALAPEVCAGFTLEISSTPSGGTPGYTYSWSGPGGFTASTQNISRANSTVSMSGTYNLTITDSKGCIGTTSVNATVNPNPTVSALAPEVCAGFTLEISSTPSGGTPGYTFIWSGPGGFTANTQNISRANSTVSMSGTYNLTITDSKGCVANTSVQAVVNPNPEVTLNAPAICEGSTLEITSSPSGGTPGYSYSWSGPGGFTANSQNVSRPNATVAMSGPYSVTVTDTKGCFAVNSINAVVEPKAKVGDFVWEDTNGNGRQDVGESGINGVSVSLFNAANNALVASTVTDSRNAQPGYYEFEVCKGTYYIVFGDYPGFVRTIKNAPNTNATNDSDANVNTGRSDNFTLNPGDNNMTIDAGYYRPASLGDYVWEDLNVDGIQDGNEPGISGVVVRLLDENGIQLRFTVTNINGYYLFDNLTPGNYIVKFDTKAGYIPTAQDRGLNDAVDSDADPITGRSQLVTLASGQQDLTIDAGFYRLARIGDFVWEDTNLNNRQDPFEPVLQGVQVNLTGTKGTDGSPVNLVTFTDNMGRYDFNNLTPGVYTVTFTRPGSQYLSVTPNVGSDDLDSDADPITGQTGSYNLSSGEYNNTIDAGYYRCAKVGDFVWVDLGSNPNIQDAGDIGINNVEVRLYQAFTNILIETQYTRNSPVDGRAGYYLFECVLPGTYYIKVIKPAPSGQISSYEFVQPNQGGDDMLDSDVVDFLNGTTLNFTVGYAQIILDIDIGLITVLPVQVKDLTGWWNKKDDVNELSWVTTKETNNKHFTIERSFAGGRFSEIGKVDGQGFSSSETKYSFDDADIAKNGDYVYRVSQTDFDGTRNVLGEVLIRIVRDDSYNVRVFPNPAKDNVTIEVGGNPGKEVSYEMYNASGQLVAVSRVFETDAQGSYKFTVDLMDYLQGIYYARIKVGDQQVIQRIVKVD